jgi:D-3-phosphoglycerate dehydrogenase
MDLNIVSKEELLAKSDFITVHTPLTDSTRDFINKENLSQLKDGVRLINCARGGIYNEEALAKGLETGKIAGVALDVLMKEPPPPDHPLLKLENCILTPHLGASTGDAEFAVAMDTVSQMTDFFTKGISNFALNFPTLDPAAMKFLNPYITGGEKTGKLLANLCSGDFSKIEVRFNGEITGSMTQPIMTSLLKGALSISMGDEVNSVNAPYLAKDRGIEVSKSEHGKVGGYENSIQVIFAGNKGAEYEISYTVVQDEPMVISMNRQPIEFRPDGILIILENKDVPKVVGMTGMFLGDHGINIARLELSRDSRGGTARCVITVDEMLESKSLHELTKMNNIISAMQLDLR